MSAKSHAPWSARTIISVVFSLVFIGIGMFWGSNTITPERFENRDDYDRVIGVASTVIIGLSLLSAVAVGDILTRNRPGASKARRLDPLTWAVLLSAGYFLGLGAYCVSILLSSGATPQGKPASVSMSAVSTGGLFILTTLLAGVWLLRHSKQRKENAK